tara:strand:+ start:104 stop:421 length:318 start_codon:yes stop_codon:yes gene_type:complete
MSLDHEAIYKSHSNIVRIEGDKCYDASNNVVVPVQSDVDAATVELNKTQYQIERVSLGSTVHYPDIFTQLDQLYHDMADGKLGVGATTGSWYVGISSVKSAHPKP